LEQVELGLSSLQMPNLLNNLKDSLFWTSLEKTHWQTTFFFAIWFSFFLLISLILFTKVSFMLNDLHILIQSLSLNALVWWNELCFFIFELVTKTFRHDMQSKFMQIFLNVSLSLESSLKFDPFVILQLDLWVTNGLLLLLKLIEQE